MLLSAPTPYGLIHSHSTPWHPVRCNNLSIPIELRPQDLLVFEGKTVLLAKLAKPQHPFPKADSRHAAEVLATTDPNYHSLVSSSKLATDLTYSSPHTTYLNT